MPEEKAHRYSGRGEKTRSSILEAAESLFAMHGFAGAGVEEIAEEAGVSYASLFYHFKDKGDLYSNVLRGVFLPFFEDVQKILVLSKQLENPSSGPVLLEQALSLHVDFAVHNPNAARLLLREIIDYDPEENPELGAMVRPVVRQVTDFLEEKLPGSGINPLDLFQAVAGFTLLFVTTAPILDPGKSNGKFSDPEVQRHKKALIRMVTSLVGKGTRHES